MPNKLVMSFDEYIKSPSGRGSAVNPGRESSESMYKTKLDEAINKHGDIKYTCLRSSNGNTYYIYFLIPSDSTKGFYYDVVVELDEPKGEGKSSGDISKYNVKFFANDPSFIFTYAHAYKTHGLLISQLEKKINLRSLMSKANVRNPDNTVGYVKSIYFAYLIMKKYNLFDKSILDRKCINGGINYLLREIPSYSDKESQKKKLIQDNRKDSKDKKENKSKISHSLNFTGSLSNAPVFTKVTGSIKSIKNISKVKSIKKSKKI